MVNFTSRDKSPRISCLGAVSFCSQCVKTDTDAPTCMRSRRTCSDVFSSSFNRLLSRPNLSQIGTSFGYLTFSYFCKALLKVNVFGIDRLVKSSRTRGQSTKREARGRFGTMRPENSLPFGRAVHDQGSRKENRSASSRSTRRKYCQLPSVMRRADEIKG